MYLKPLSNAALCWSGWNLRAITIMAVSLPLCPERLNFSKPNMIAQCKLKSQPLEAVATSLVALVVVAVIRGYRQVLSLLY